MGKFTLYGILIILAIFFSVTTFILSKIEVENPLTGTEESVIDWLVPDIDWDWWPF